MRRGHARSARPREAELNPAALHRVGRALELAGADETLYESRAGRRAHPEMLGDRGEAGARIATNVHQRAKLRNGKAATGPSAHRLADVTHRPRNDLEQVVGARGELDLTHPS